MREIKELIKENLAETKRFMNNLEEKTYQNDDKIIEEKIEKTYKNSRKTGVNDQRSQISIDDLIDPNDILTKNNTNKCEVLNVFFNTVFTKENT